MTAQNVQSFATTNYKVEVFNKNGDLITTDEFDNLVPNQGLDDILDKYWKGSNYTAQHYVGLKGVGTAIATDTADSHPSWTEVTDYTGERQQPALGDVSNQGVTADVLTYVATADNIAVSGAFTATSETKGSTAGVLCSVGDFTNPVTLNTGDSIRLTIQYRQQSA